MAFCTVFRSQKDLFTFKNNCISRFAGRMLLRRSDRAYPAELKKRSTMSDVGKMNFVDSYSVTPFADVRFFLMMFFAKSVSRVVGNKSIKSWQLSNLRKTVLTRSIVSPSNHVLQQSVAANQFEFCIVPRFFFFYKWKRLEVGRNPVNPAINVFNRRCGECKLGLLWVLFPLWMEGLHMIKRVCPTSTCFSNNNPFAGFIANFSVTFPCWRSWIFAFLVKVS